uniref:Uncharacterized protein n=1 Tax=Anopheles coluzzii TaxID=1518534 RepID=A0A8W7PWX2_ANOCL
MAHVAHTGPCVVEPIVYADQHVGAGEVAFGGVVGGAACRRLFRTGFGIGYNVRGTHPHPVGGTVPRVAVLGEVQVQLIVSFTLGGIQLRINSIKQLGIQTDLKGLAKFGEILARRLIDQLRWDVVAAVKRIRTKVDRSVVLLGQCATICSADWETQPEGRVRSTPYSAKFLNISINSSSTVPAVFVSSLYRSIPLNAMSLFASENPPV